MAATTPTLARDMDKRGRGAIVRVVVDWGDMSRMVVGLVCLASSLYVVGMFYAFLFSIYTRHKHAHILDVDSKQGFSEAVYLRHAVNYATRL
jgi:hypothetical protein